MSEWKNNFTTETITTPISPSYLSTRQLSSTVPFSTSRTPLQYLPPGPLSSAPPSPKTPAFSPPSAKTHSTWVSRIFRRYQFVFKALLRNQVCAFLRETIYCRDSFALHMVELLGILHRIQCQKPIWHFYYSYCSNCNMASLLAYVYSSLMNFTCEQRRWNKIA